MYVEKTAIDEMMVVGAIWKMNDERNKGLRYPDGTPKTFYKGRTDLNTYGYPHRKDRCPECGEWECDYQGVGHYRG